MASLLQPDTGRLWFDGLPYAQNLPLLRSQIGYLPQELDFPHNLTPRQLLEYIGTLKNIPEADQVEHLLSTLGLESVADRPFGRLSGGQIITATEAKSEALRGLGHPFYGTPTDAVIIASEGVVVHPSAGILTEVGHRIHAAVLFGIPEALRRHEGVVTREASSYFIFSRFGGDHWVEWLPKACPYYPCHFEGQRCEFCYCPFYPCGDESLGQWVRSSSRNGPVWNCAGCTLLHQPGIADYLIQNPEASLRELKMRQREKQNEA